MTKCSHVATNYHVDLWLNMCNVVSDDGEIVRICHSATSDVKVFSDIYYYISQAI